MGNKISTTTPNKKIYNDQDYNLFKYERKNDIHRKYIQTINVDIAVHNSSDWSTLEEDPGHDDTTLVFIVVKDQIAGYIMYGLDKSYHPPRFDIKLVYVLHAFRKFGICKKAFELFAGQFMKYGRFSMTPVDIPSLLCYVSLVNTGRWVCEVEEWSKPVTKLQTPTDYMNYKNKLKASAKYEHVQLTFYKNGQGGGSAPTYATVLGRKRRIQYINDTAMVVCMGRLIRLSEAINMERKVLKEKLVKPFRKSNH